MENQNAAQRVKSEKRDQNECGKRRSSAAENEKSRTKIEKMDTIYAVILGNRCRINEKKYLTNRIENGTKIGEN